MQDRQARKGWGARNGAVRVHGMDAKARRQARGEVRAMWRPVIKGRLRVRGTDR